MCSKKNKYSLLEPKCQTTAINGSIHSTPCSTRLKFCAKNYRNLSPSRRKQQRNSTGVASESTASTENSPRHKIYVSTNTQPNSIGNSRLLKDLRKSLKSLIETNLYINDFRDKIDENVNLKANALATLPVASHARVTCFSIYASSAIKNSDESYYYSRSTPSSTNNSKKNTEKKSININDNT